MLKGHFDLEYTGLAINPDSLIDPNVHAIKQMNQLLADAGFNEEE